MTKDPRALARELEVEEIQLRMNSAHERIETRFARAQDKDRDLTAREAELTKADRDEIGRLIAAQQLQEYDIGQQVQQRSAQIGEAIDGHRASVQAGQVGEQLAAFGAGLRAGVPQRIVLDSEVLTRSATVATTGETSQVSARSGRPPFIWSALRIPFERAESHKVEGPTWQPLVSQAGTAEGGTKPTMTDAVLDSQDLAAYGVVHTVSDKVVRFGVGEAAVAARLAAEAVFSVNGGIIDRFETHGTEIAFVTDAPTSLDTAIAEVVSRTGGATGIILNAADYPAVAARSANSAADVESGTIAGYNGLPLFMHPSMLAGHAIVVNGMWLSAHATDVLMASLPVLSTNEIDLRAEVYAAVLIGDASAVQRVDISSAA